MKNLKLTVFLLMSTVFLIPQTQAQVCETGEGNIFNATLLLHESIVTPLQSDESIVAISGDHCVGETFGTSPGATAIPLTIWADDPLSDSKNGLSPGESFTIYLKMPSGTIPLPMEADAIYIIKAASIDTTWSITLDSLMIQVGEITLLLDSTLVELDSLQGLVDNFPASLADVQQRLDSANDRVAFLESSIAEVSPRLFFLQAALRSMIIQLKDRNN